jgi:hypothetical protein
MSQARLNEGTGAETADPRWKDLYRIGETTCVLLVGWRHVHPGNQGRW